MHRKSYAGIILSGSSWLYLISERERQSDERSARSPACLTLSDPHSKRINLKSREGVVRAAFKAQQAQYGARAWPLVYQLQFQIERYI